LDVLELEFTRCTQIVVEAAKAGAPVHNVPAEHPQIDDHVYYLGPDGRVDTRRPVPDTYVEATDGKTGYHASSTQEEIDKLAEVFPLLLWSRL
jgi:hypothetical protein